MDITGSTLFVEENITVHLGSANRKHYQELGYDVENKKDIYVKLCDLPKKSGVKVSVICPVCQKTRVMTRQKATKIGHTICNACRKRETRFQNITGKRFRRLVALKPVGKDNQNATKWLCQCDCGNTSVTTITRLNNGLTSSCGCLAAERTAAAISGSKNVRFNPLLTDDDRIDRRIIPEYREWQRLVKIRDGFMCDKCGKLRDKRMASHHLNAWSGFPE